MYIRSQRDTSASVRGTYLILVCAQDDAATPRDQRLRAFLRYVRLVQSGPWMHGYAVVNEKELHLSGSAGADGLPLTVDVDTWSRGVLVPEEIQRAYWTCEDSWNDVGVTPGRLLRHWARATEKELKQAGRKHRVVKPFVPSWEPSDAGPLNLECETEAVLQSIRALRGRSLRHAADKLFPDRRGRYTLLRHDYRYLASSILHSRFQRERGDIDGALRSEDYTDRLYNDLPLWARW